MNPHTIWKYRNHKIIALAITSLAITSNSFAECIELTPGIYTPDNTANARLDGGKLERVIAIINSTSRPKSVVGTTGHLAPAISINNEGHIYTTIGNDYNEKYETLSVQSTAKIEKKCSSIAVEFEAENYYPNYIKIGEIPKKTPTPLPHAIKAIMQGEMLDKNTIKITKCSAYAFNKKENRWDLETDGGALCASGTGYKLFNVIEYIKNKHGWSVK